MESFNKYLFKEKVKSYLTEVLGNYSGPNRLTAVVHESPGFGASIQEKGKKEQKYFVDFSDDLRELKVKNFTYSGNSDDEIIFLNESFAKIFGCNKIEFQKFGNIFNRNLILQSYRKNGDSYFRVLK